ncbi:uncharacterized protein [Dermacentor albipictus]|uniref:uncharacterized protein n=1 Tax=Dermacentor albipictus TaxID=60249 RepID=UPI0038FBEF3D
MVACVNPCKKPQHVCHPGSVRDDKGCFEADCACFPEHCPKRCPPHQECDVDSLVDGLGCFTANCRCSSISPESSRRNCSNFCPPGEKCHAYAAVDAQGCPLPGCVCVPDCISPCRVGKRCKPNSPLDAKGCFKEGCKCESDCTPRCPVGMNCELHSPRDLHGCFLMGCSCESSMTSTSNAIETSKCSAPCPPGMRCVENSTKDERGCFVPGCSCESAPEVLQLWRKVFPTRRTTSKETTQLWEETNASTTHKNHDSYSSGPPDSHILISDGRRIITDRITSSQENSGLRSKEKTSINIFWPPENGSSMEGQPQQNFVDNIAVSTIAEIPDRRKEHVPLGGGNTSASFSAELRSDKQGSGVLEANGSEGGVATIPETPSTKSGTDTSLASTARSDGNGTTSVSTNALLLLDENDDNDDGYEASDNFSAEQTNGESVGNLSRKDVFVASSLPRDTTIGLPRITHEQNATSLLRNDGKK